MTSFSLKVLACIFMLIDHVAEFVPGMPVQMHWIGRLAAPIFLFLVGWSCEFTHDRTRYLRRLYVAGVCMAIVQGVLGISNNVFTSLFQVALIVSLLSREDAHERARGIAAYLLYETVLTLVLWYAIAPLDVPDVVLRVAVAATGSILGLEGGLFYVMLGVALWAARDRKILLSTVFVGLVVLFSLAMSSYSARVLFALIRHRNPIVAAVGDQMFMLLDILGIPRFAMGRSIWTLNYQWMMAFALPFLLAYNKQRGPGIKWFFYAFYPAHIVALYGIGQLATMLVGA